jgi:thiamine-phosphate pyrophosphorylase
MIIAFPPLYAILDALWLKTSQPSSPEMALSQELALAQELAEAGVQLLQYRNKRATSRQLFEVGSALSKHLSSLTGVSRVRFIMNDRPDIAVLTGAGGVHVGQEDLPVEAARALVGPDRWVGISTHNLDQLAAADRTSADYLAFGPIFTTATKQRPDPLVGLEGLAAARAKTRKPLVAIGGITLENAAEVYAAGADSLAVARDILAAERPGARARAYLEVAARRPRLSGAAQPGSPQGPR